METVEKSQGRQPVAWNRRGTKAAWNVWVLQHSAKSIGWFGAQVGLLYVTLLLPVWFAWVAPLFFGLLMYCLVTSLVRLSNARRMYLVLCTYPWQRQADGVRAKKGRYAVFVLPDPDKPNKTVSPKEPGVLLKRWNRVVRKGFKGELWYAGDPRFMVVVAKPGLKSLGLARQPQAFDRRTSPRSRGLSPEARRRALAIGARVGPERGQSAG
jgi:hypothetical protein